jgi:hypothetical protein
VLTWLRVQQPGNLGEGLEDQEGERLRQSWTAGSYSRLIDFCIPQLWRVIQKKKTKTSARAWRIRRGMVERSAGSGVPRPDP